VLAADLVANAEAWQYFERDVSLSLELQHPNIVAVYRCGELKDGRPYAVMQPVDGWTLGDRIAREGPLSLPEAYGVLHDVAAALSAMHARRLIHADVNPTSVLQERHSFRAFVTNLGNASPANGSRSIAGELGTVRSAPRFMSPEQIMNAPLTTGADVYALGLLSYRLLTGMGLFEDGNLHEQVIAQLNGSLSALHDLRPEVDAIVSDFLRKCLEPRAEFRPSAQDVADFFQRNSE
jgi:eukaryotic-like serine/threonine-protein kinase